VPTTQYTIDENSTRDELGQALAALRSRTGITQEQLAARLGIDSTYVSQVECGRRGVRWHTVLRFLSGLDASLHQLAEELEPLNEPAAG
jgi:transcriptional regulator with XRE-family HTH domain